MIQKTVKEFKRYVRRVGEKVHTERILVETWWFLFVPIYIKHTLVSRSL